MANIKFRIEKKLKSVEGKDGKREVLEVDVEYFRHETGGLQIRNGRPVPRSIVDEEVTDKIRKEFAEAYQKFLVSQQDKPEKAPAARKRKIFKGVSK